MLADSPQRPIAAVLVNGTPVDSRDAAGNFFITVTPVEGTNEYTIEAIEQCGTASLVHSFTGVPPSEIDFNAYSDVTLDVSVDYSDTTFSEQTSQLLVNATLCNTSDRVLRVPLVMVIDGFTEPTVSEAAADGYTEEGRPFYVFDEDAPLGPGECTSPRLLAFDNPDEVPVFFTVTILAPDNQPPLFDSTPLTLAAADAPYGYSASATDPDGDPVTFALDTGPTGVSIDGATGAVAWSPTPADIGRHPEHPQRHSDAPHA